MGGQLASQWWGHVFSGLAIHRIVLRRAPLKDSHSITLEPFKPESQAPSQICCIRIYNLKRFLGGSFRFKKQWSKRSAWDCSFQQQDPPSPLIFQLYPFTFHFWSLNRFLCCGPEQTISIWMNSQPVGPTGYCTDSNLHFYGQVVKRDKAQPPTSKTIPIPLQVILPSLFPQL